MPNFTLAQKNNEGEKVVVYKNSMTENEKQAEREKQVKQHLEKLNLKADYKVVFGEETISPLNEPSDYKHEYGTPKIAIVGGYAGNQGSAGTRFLTGGGFYYSTSGGPTASVSVSFPKPFTFFSLSANLGNSSTSGIFVTVPNTYDYFKLYAEKEYEITPYVIYQNVWIDDFTGYQWVQVSGGHSKIHLGTTVYAKKV